MQEQPHLQQPAGTPLSGVDSDSTSDEDLLSRLRTGDRTAYTELWRRHVTAALRLGNRISPGSADDLVSEAFLAVYHQVTVIGGGPTSSFRAYLFTVMRNTAMQWQRDGNPVITVPELGWFDELVDVHEQSPLDLLEQESTSAELLTAMTELPERWQRVLWLSEVEEASRTQIASELGIRPNAVSALYRRARGGLRMNWLMQQIPLDLREDTSHSAHLLPRLIVDGRAAGIHRDVRAHLDQCDTCSGVYAELKSDYGQMRKVTLSLAGFLALGGSVPAMTPFATAGGATAVAAILGGGAVTTGLGALVASAVAASLIVGVVTLTGVHRNGGNQTTATDSQTSSPQPQAEASAAETESSVDADAPSKTDTESGTSTDIAHDQPLGFGNLDPAVPVVNFGDIGYVAPPIPEKAPPGTLPGPSTEVSPVDTFELLSATAQDGFVAPTIAGRAAPGSSVVVELAQYSSHATGPAQYLVPVTPEGDWTFDFQPLLPDRPGTYDYRVWSFTDEVVTQARHGQFTLSPPTVRGFEALPPFGVIDISEASTSGIVFEVSGAIDGLICLDSVYADQRAYIPLSASGTSTQRIQFLKAGTYFLTFRGCEGGFHGPAVEVWVDVSDPDLPPFSPWGPDPIDTAFVLAEL